MNALLQACVSSALPGLMAFLIAVVGFFALVATVRMMRAERRALESALGMLTANTAATLQLMREELQSLAAVAACLRAEQAGSEGEAADDVGYPLDVRLGRSA